MEPLLDKETLELINEILSKPVKQPFWERKLTNVREKDENNIKDEENDNKKVEEEQNDDDGDDE